jgi:predicted DNA-binding protein (MmcQ/YjbR family)
MSRAARPDDAAAIRAFALAYPEATEDFPWGHSAFKVRGKAFAFMTAEDGALHLSVKLPISGAMALGLPFAEPTGYGLGKAGWVSAAFERGAAVPLPLLREWIDESYRAVAPKRLVAALDGAPAGRAPSRGTGASRAARSRAAGRESTRAAGTPGPRGRRTRGGRGPSR